VRITEIRFGFGYLITEPSEILKTETSVIQSLFMDIRKRKPTNLNGLQVNHYVVSIKITQSTTNTKLVTITNLMVQSPVPTAYLSLLICQLSICHALICVLFEKTIIFKTEPKTVYIFGKPKPNRNRGFSENRSETEPKISYPHTPTKSRKYYCC
jgi:hypothetical protein